VPCTPKSRRPLAALQHFSCFRTNRRFMSGCSLLTDYCSLITDYLERRTRQEDSRRWTSVRESAGFPDIRQVTSRRRSRASVREDGSSRRACWFSLEIKSSIPEGSAGLATREVFRGPVQAVSWPFTRVRFVSIFMARSSCNVPNPHPAVTFLSAFAQFFIKMAASTGCIVFPDPRRP